MVVASDAMITCCGFSFASEKAFEKRLDIPSMKALRQLVDNLEQDRRRLQRLGFRKWANEVEHVQGRK